MGSHLALIIFGVVTATLLSTCSHAFPAFVDNVDDGPYRIVGSDEYDDYAPAAVKMKRFFTNHPSDYNPMRRPGVPIPRGEGVPFHPVPRVVTTGEAGDDIADSEGYIENGRQKKQTSAGPLLFRLGSLMRRRRKPTVPPRPTIV